MGASLAESPRRFYHDSQIDIAREIAMNRSSTPNLIGFLMVHAAIGFAVAAVFTIGLIYANPGGIGTLLAHADGWPIPTILLWFLLGLTTSSCQMGAAIMLLGSPPEGGNRGRGLEWVISLLRLPISAPRTVDPRGQA